MRRTVAGGFTAALISAYKGQSVTVKFSMNEDSYLQTSFVVDDTSLNVS